MSLVLCHILHMNLHLMSPVQHLKSVVDGIQKYVGKDQRDSGILFALYFFITGYIMMFIVLNILYLVILLNILSCIEAPSIFTPSVLHITLNSSYDTVINDVYNGENLILPT